MSKNPYNNKKVPIYPFINIPLPAKRGEVNILQIDAKAQTLIHSRDCLFEGSWNKMLHYITTEGTFEQIEFDRVIICNLEKIEKKHKINLGKLLRKYVPLEKTNDL
jgi:hypothetical protein